MLWLTFLSFSWPELVGKDGSVAAEEVRKECADCDIRVANQVKGNIVFSKIEFSYDHGSSL